MRHPGNERSWLPCPEGEKQGKRSYWVTGIRQEERWLRVLPTEPDCHNKTTSGLSTKTHGSGRLPLDVIRLHKQAFTVVNIVV